MGSSIQDYLKKINSKLSIIDCISLLITLLLLAVLTLYLQGMKIGGSRPVSYLVANTDTPVLKPTISAPFASVNGKTYTYSWCQGAGIIKETNRIYYSNEAEAIASGKTLSKLCSR